MENQENRSISLHQLALGLMLVSTLMTSCETAEVFPNDDLSVSLEASIAYSDVWSTEIVQSRGGTSGSSTSSSPLYLVYLFGSNNKAITNSGDDMANVSKPLVFSSDIKTTGTYTLYGVTNVYKTEVPSMAGTPKPVVTSSTIFTLSPDAPKDVCLGSQQVTITASQQAYSQTITVSHIMSKLALTVKSVPSDVSSLAITLPKQANVFDFTGTLAGDTVSQKLILTKAATANTDGTYNWTCPATIVFPCATGTTSMPIKITWGSSTVNSKDVSTTSSTCCLSGKNLSLSTTWNESYRISAPLTTSSWSDVEEATYDW